MLSWLVLQSGTALVVPAGTAASGRTTAVTTRAVPDCSTNHSSADRIVFNSYNHAWKEAQIHLLIHQFIFMSIITLRGFMFISGIFFVLPVCVKMKKILTKISQPFVCHQHALHISVCADMGPLWQALLWFQLPYMVCLCTAQQPRSLPL